MCAIPERAGKRVAILVAHGFEQVELDLSRSALNWAGAQTQVVSSARGLVRGMNHDRLAAGVKVDVALETAKADDYDAVLLPGGVMSLDSLRGERKAVEFVRAFFAAGKPVAAICHGPQVLIEAEVVRGRKLTSCPSIKTDLRNAGAEWVDEPVVVDQSLVTSRRPEDIPLFNEKMLEQIVRLGPTPQIPIPLATIPNRPRKAAGRTVATINTTLVKTKIFTTRDVFLILKTSVVSRTPATGRM